MKKNQSIDKERMFELEQNSLIEKTAKAIANGDMLIDVRVDSAPLLYHPWLSELRKQFKLEDELHFVEDFIFDRAVINYTKRVTLGFSTGGFLKNAINGNLKQFQQDVNQHAVDMEFDDNHVLTAFKIKMDDISVLKIMNIRS